MPLSTLSEVDRKTLTPIVRAALERTTVEVVEWQVAPILHGRASSAGVFRLTGTAVDQGQMLSWSVMAKTFQSSVQATMMSRVSEDPQAILYWKRELLLYQSELFEDLPDGFATPRCYQIDDEPHEGRVWLEDVHEDVSSPWPLEQYGRAARHLGRFNGRFLTGQAAPAWPWLAKDPFRQRLQRIQWPDFWSIYPTLRKESALVQRGWSDELAEHVNHIRQVSACCWS